MSAVLWAVVVLAIAVGAAYLADPTSVTILFP